jgi:hypothetical protein
MEPGVWHFPSGLPGTPLITSLWVYLSPGDTKPVRFVQEGSGFTYGAQERDRTPAPEFQMPFRVLVDRSREDYLFKIIEASADGFDFNCRCIEAVRIGEGMKLAGAGGGAVEALFEAAGFDPERERRQMLEERSMDARGLAALDLGEGAKTVKLIEERPPFQGFGKDKVPYLLSKETVLVDIGLGSVICTFRRGMFVLSGKVPAGLLPELVEKFDSRVFSSLLLASVLEFLRFRNVPVNTGWWERVIRTMRRQELNGWKPAAPGEEMGTANNSSPAVGPLVLEAPGGGFDPLAVIPGMPEGKLVEKLVAAGWKIGLRVEPVEAKEEGKEEEVPVKRTRRFDWG